MPMLSRCLRVLFVSALLAGTMTRGFAHEGHDHAAEAETAAVVTGAASPRLTLSSAQVELVAVREPQALVIYVDDYATNAPLDGLNLQLRVGQRVISAMPAGAGVYTIADALLDEAGESGQDAKILLHGAGLDQQFEARLPSLPHAVPASHVPGENQIAAIVLVAVLMILVVAIVMIGRRRQARGHARLHA